ncbi:S8 family serine peptidase [Intrasporangium sp.]|uniref:S8 family peptidase n=1 Tax=Intrasporangium sp. TaxID=1925024 RepID=UPI00336575C0
MKRRLLGAVTAVPLALAMAGTGAADAAVTQTDSSFTDGIYVIQMADLPVVAYDGSVAGYQATKPAKGTKIDPQSAAVTKYVDRLKGAHNKALGAVGSASKLYDYAYTYNGFAARLTADQAKKMSNVSGVLAVSKQETYSIDTSTTPAFLGLTDKGGLWDQLGGTKSAGEDIVIGVVDSGIWPESLSFADRIDATGKPSFAPGANRAYTNLPSFNGRCQVGEDFNGSNCNQKLVAARYFNQGQGGDAGINKDRPWEFNSPRDYNGHGTHTAGTAGGNYNVPVDGLGAAVAPNGISGMAPRARISAYKALWSTESGDTAGGTTSDLVAAIDTAVADGVDVINYSISGTQTNFADPAEIAFLFAANAGIFVAASAGNSGPATSTVAHPSPWITTVAAGTHNRSGNGSVTLGNGTTYNGASLAGAAVTADFVDSTAVGKAGADATQVQLCYSSADGGNVLDPAKVAGKIVLCERGVTARTNKSLAVKEAGGVGMILVNPSDNSVNADFHFVPTVHLNSNVYAAVKAYAATAGARATINKATLTTEEPAPFTASFSSRGPLRAGGGDLLKPDVIAPGQDILAAYSPMTNQGYGFNQISGTSMSSPHVAGLAALLMDLHPDWSPMAVKSALMTTGYDVLDGGTPAPSNNPTLIFRQGAGHVAPNKAASPGLVYDSSWNDWLAFLCGNSRAVGAATCDALVGMGYSTDASDFNGASIAIGDLAGVQTVNRKVTNVGDSPATYRASVSGLSGLTAEVSPSSITVGPGESATFTVKFTRTSAALNAFTGGQLTWSDGTHAVRSPIVIRPVALAAPAQVTAPPAGTSYDVTFGYSGAFTAEARGLVPAAVTAGTVSDDPTDSTCSLSSPNAQKIDVAVPAGTTYARFSMFDADVNPGTDIDLCVFNGTTLVGSSGSGTSAEEVNLLNPAAATYTVVVQGWGVAGSTPFKLHTWLLGSSAAGNMTVDAPATATLGQKGTIGLSFSGLAPATKYLGSVAYSGSPNMPSPTIVRVDVP